MGNYKPVTVNQKGHQFVVIDKSKGIERHHAARMKPIDLAK